MPAVLVRAVCSRTSAAASPDGAKKSLAKSASQPAVGQLQRVGRLTRGPSPRRAWERRRAHVGHRGTGERLGAADGAASGVAGSGASYSVKGRARLLRPPAAAASRRPQPVAPPCRATTNVRPCLICQKPEKAPTAKPPVADIDPTQLIGRRVKLKDGREGTIQVAGYAARLRWYLYHLVAQERPGVPVSQTPRFFRSHGVLSHAFRLCAAMGWSGSG